MSAATHTPGPWRIGGDCDGFAWVVAPDGRSVANIEDGSFARRVRFEAQTVKANAALIAAAPELLAALTLLIKAGEKLHADLSTVEGMRNMGALLSASDAARAAIAKAKVAP
jgi:hypothetical protein